MRARALGLGGLALASGLGAWWVSHRSAPTPAAPVTTTSTTAAAARATSAAPAVQVATGCSFVGGQSFGFDFTYKLDMEVSGEGLAPVGQGKGHVAEKQRIEATSSGTVQGRVVSVSSTGEAIVAVRMTVWKSDPPAPEEVAGIEADLTRPYLLRLGARCQVLTSARHRTASPVAYARVLGLYDQIDFVTPERSGGLPYTGSHQDDLGAFTASYLHTLAGGGRGTLARTRVAYGHQVGASELPLTFHINQAAGTVRLGDALWFSDIQQSDDIEGRIHGKTPLHQRSQSHFWARPVDPQAFARDAIELSEFVWGRPGQQELIDARDRVAHHDLRGLSAAAAWQRLREISGSKKPGAWHDAQAMLRAWLKVNPQAARDLARILRGHQGTEGDRADAVLAMAKSGSDGARRELEAMARDTGLDERLRTQATSALADLVNPTTQTVDTLSRLASRPVGADMHDFVGSSATMALGTLIDAHPGTAVAEAAQAYLDQRLQDNQPLAVSEALWSVGNSGDTHFLPAVLDRAQSEDSGLRAAAAHAMRHMPPSQAQPVLGQLMRDDTDPEVVKEVAGSQLEQITTYGTLLSDDELSYYATKLMTGPVPVRWEIIRTLGAASVKQPRARLILASWFPHETENSLRLLLGKYLTAADLSAAHLAHIHPTDTGETCVESTDRWRCYADCT